MGNFIRKRFEHKPTQQQHTAAAATMNSTIKLRQTRVVSKSNTTRTRVVTMAKRSAKKVTKTSGGDGPLGNLDIGGFFAPDTYYDGAKSSKAKSKERAVGYRGSGEKGSAPDVDSQGKRARLGGVVYQFANKYGGNIDEYSPIWTPETRQPGADVYEPGVLGLAIWFAGLVGLLAVGGFAIYSTSALG